MKKIFIFTLSLFLSVSIFAEESVLPDNNFSELSKIAKNATEKIKDGEGSISENAKEYVKSDEGQEDLKKAKDIATSEENKSKLRKFTDFFKRK